MAEETREVQAISDIPGIADDFKQHFLGETPNWATDKDGLMQKTALPMPS